MKKRLNGSFLLALILATGANLVTSHSARADLDQKYLRNGECYMLIGEGSLDFKGIYRMNNPAAGITSVNQKVIPGTSFGEKDTIGFNVDLNRHIYTFSENSHGGFVLKQGNIFRQVLDTTTDDQADMGSGSYHHTDNRPTGERNKPIYRTISSGAATREVRRETTWGSCSNTSPRRRCTQNDSQCKVKALNPGTVVSVPAGFSLPVFDQTSSAPLINLDIQNGKNWYSVPNGSWWSSWRKNRQGYMVYCDKVMEQTRDYDKWRFENLYAAQNTNDVSFSGNHQNQGSVGSASDTYTIRNYVCGCLDSCANAGGTGNTTVIETIVSIAMQPSFDGGPERVYTLSREKDSSNYKLEIKRDSAAQTTYPVNSGYVRGYPGNADNVWIGISLKNANSDYVYIMGDSTIKEWYKLANGVTSVPSDMEITAVGVSNLWNENGGIIYAYDKGPKLVYSFECTDSGSPSLQTSPGSIKFKIIDVKDAINSMGGDASKCEIDDIKADGFGSLYFGLSFPTLDRSTFDPREHLKPRFAVHVCVLNVDEETGNVALNFILPQEYAKTVFEKKYNGGSIEKIGSRVFAREYYNLQIIVTPSVYSTLTGGSTPYMDPEGTHNIYNDGWVNIVKTAAAQDPTNRIVNGAGVPFNEVNWETSPQGILSGQGCEHAGFTPLSGSDPGRCELAVINVPTPPKMTHIGSTPDSYLDIIGPYENYPIYNLDNNSTQQDQGLLHSGSGAPDQINNSKLYFYMVENYPMYETAQNPNWNPDWDNDGRYGGFVSSIVNPYPAGNIGGNTGTIRYHWKLWKIRSYDMNDQPIDLCEVANEIDGSSGMPYYALFDLKGGKFILTCRVSYDWYDYDSIPFGSTIDILPTVLHTNTFALPSKSGLIADGQPMNPVDRLNEIKNLRDFEFMKTSGIDYSPIYSGTNGDFWAMEPINVATGTAPTPKTYTVGLQKCDDVAYLYSNPSDPAVKAYYENQSNWSDPKVDPDNTSKKLPFVIESGKTYNWRIELDSQRKLLTDISTLTGLTESSNDFNIVAKEITDNGYPGAPPELVFENRPGDTKWANDIVSIYVALEYMEPGNPNSKTLPLVYDDNPASDGMFKETVNPVDFSLSNPWANQKPLIASSPKTMFPSDPQVATITITMARDYFCTLYMYYEGRPIRVGMLPGRITMTGATQVQIIDTGNPSFAWNETTPNNLFGIVGRSLDKYLVGPSGENQERIKFTVIDNNPWESSDLAGLPSLDEHVKNYVYNFGAASFTQKFSNNAKMMEVYNRYSSLFLSPSYYQNGNMNGLIKEIDNLLRNNQKTSHLDLKPLFCREARDVRIAFETSTRDSSGKVTLQMADKDFSQDHSKYSFHYRSRNDNNQVYVPSYIDIFDTPTPTYNLNGKSEAKVVYSVDTDNLEVGYTDGDDKNFIPDGYANNTTGYAVYDASNNIVDIRPYKFYVSAVDSSGNYSGEKELNVVLHVKDDIPPMAYGVMKEFKDNRVWHLPDHDTDTATPSYTVEGQYYMTATGSTTGIQHKGLVPEVLRANDWITQATNGYINSVPPHDYYYNYKAMPYLNNGDIILTNLGQNTNFIDCVSCGYSPRPVEDNIECQFQVYTNDNCGFASATLVVKFYRLEANGVYAEDSLNAVSSWNSGALLKDRGGNTIADNNIASDTSHNSVFTLFRGNDSMFPMAIPIRIMAEDNARDWDWYDIGATVLSNEGADWSWDKSKIRTGGLRRNNRTFKTTLPVFGSQLDIRTLDKTIKNSNH